MKYKCPFCNGKNVGPFRETPTLDFSDSGYHGECKDCIATGPTRYTKKEAMSVFCNPPYPQKPKSAKYLSEGEDGPYGPRK